ncbi:MAG: N-acetylglucosamine-6-phosphate deacetylase [Acidimicrobiales bacterium]
MTTSPGQGVISAAAVVTPEEVLEPGYVVIADERIREVMPGLPPHDLATPGAVIDASELGGEWLVPGFVDIHVHGGGGAQVNGRAAPDVAASIRTIARFHARHGTTALLPTTVSDSFDHLVATIEGISESMHHPIEGGARVIGVHLEGPWLARAKSGAQNPEALRDPDMEEFRQLHEAARSTMRLLTIAPELPGAFGIIAAALDKGVRVAVGHTDADYETVVAAFGAGATHATHLFNAMSPLHHRKPGPVGAALDDERVTLEVIADLEHVHPAVLRIIGRLAADRLVAVTDAIGPAGLGPGDYDLGGSKVSLVARRVSLAADPTTLAGSTLTMDLAVRNLVEDAGLSMIEAVRAAATTPARLLGMNDLGLIRAGAIADLAVLDARLSCVATYIGGELVKTPSDAGAPVDGDPQESGGAPG